MSSSSSPTLLSRRSSTSSGSVPSAMSLDLSNVPPLTQPTPPSNTLLFTNLQDPDIFRPDNLQSVRDLVERTAPLHSWAPLKSFRRIVASFHDEESAARVRAAWDGEAILGHRTRVFYGRHTPIHARDNQHLSLPDAGKLFFISPPPSPPHGWEGKMEDAPNKQVHAEDLAEALAKLHHHRPASPGDVGSPISPDGATTGDRKTRSRSSTLIWHPGQHGGDPDLPAISVDDMTDEPEEMGPAATQLVTHTARPPVELMHDA